MSQETTVLCSGCCLASTIILLILILSSISTLDYNEYGLDYSSIAKTVSPKPYSAGVHFLGIGHSFIRYPKTVQTMEFSSDKRADGNILKSRTNDGLEVDLEISFQYTYDFSNLFALYGKYRESHRQIIKNMAIDVISDTATEYSAYDFFIDRQSIGVAMQDRLNKYFQKNCFSTIVFFQLRSVDLPDKFENAIELSEVKKQEIQKATAEKNKAVVELETQKMSALYSRNITLVLKIQQTQQQNQAQGVSNAIMADGQAKADSFIAVQGANQRALLNLKQSLKMSNTDLLQYLKSKIIRDYAGGDIMIFLDD